MIIHLPPLFIRKLYPKSVVWELPNTRNSVYLTFDDGPIPEVTPWVLDILKGFGIKATFFMVGQNAERYPDLVKRIIAEGHSVGNHCYTHLKGWKNSRKAYLADIEKASEYVKSDLFRPPHGQLNILHANAISRNYRIIMWSVLTGDFDRNLPPDKVFENVKNYTKNGSIIVFHDSKKAEENLKANLEKSVRYLLSEGYSFEAL